MRPGTDITLTNQKTKQRPSPAHTRVSVNTASAGFLSQQGFKASADQLEVADRFCCSCLASLLVAFLGW